MKHQVKHKGLFLFFFMDRLANMASSFHLFPKLPQELRDAIWRECLPRRVIEIDIPTEEVMFELAQLPLEDFDDDDRPIHRELSCNMRKTSMINAKPPIISRVCRESRAVAFETGSLLEHPRVSEEPHLHQHISISKRWVDRARDTVAHLHVNPYSNFWVGGRNEATGHPIQLLRDVMLPANGMRSMSDKLLSRLRNSSRDLVESLSEILVCLQVLVLHTDEEPAIQSGLFGRIGEERIVMVDLFDEKRIKKFRDFWSRHQRSRDELTETFFEKCIASDPIQCRRALLKAVEDIKAEWLLKRWFDTTGPWVREQDAFGRTRWVYRIRNVPGLVREEVWEKAPPGNAHLNFRHWAPNQQHPWVRTTYSSMPKFVPVIMFRLCTNLCRRPKKD